MNSVSALLLAVSIGIAPNVMAHEVLSITHQAPLTVITLRYADGKPFAYEAFEVSLPSSEAPVQVGRTDAMGRAAVFSVPGQALDFVATSRDGHGLRLSLAAGDQVDEIPPTDIPRWLRILVGVSLLFGAFGVWQLFARKKTSS